MTFAEFIIVSRAAADKPGVIEQMHALVRPSVLCGQNTPSDLNTLTIGQLFQLQECKPEEIYEQCAIITMDLKREDILNEKAENVIGYANFVAEELKRIAALFDSTKIPPTPEQRAAGFDKLNFGSFGILDSYARRMGIHDHSEVERVPWVRIYKCLDMDAQTERCRRRMEEQQRQKLKSRH